ncbi:helix-turn-helix transcriptional regulator [Streptomyces albidoflavus]|uniref:helix-turn-helix domain-containing protein n=1 Tax=Streptomyces albidoflavus TaxID=1886 RepID=UPI0033B74A83
MSSPRHHPNELGAFLRARRAALSPGAVGLPRTVGSRRVRGLRREEVASLASISTDYYTRVEQGRRRPSAQVAEVLAGVLRLSEDERAYLLELVGTELPERPEETAPAVQPSLRRLLDALTAVPALVLGPRMDILAWNPMAAALITDFSELPDAHRNYAWLLFRDPAVRALHPDFDTVAPGCVAMLRREAGRDPHDPRMDGLVRELCHADESFRRWWGEHHVAAGNRGTKVLRHPGVGDLTLDWDALTCAHDPAQRFVIWTTAPGSPSEKRLAALSDLTRTAARPL